MFNEMEKEMLRRIHELELEDCNGCPFAVECEAHELFYGCAVWEDEMGEDLQGLFFIPLHFHALTW